MSDTYKILREEDVDTLQYRVNEFLTWGWQPHGTLIVDMSANQYERYKQVMVKLNQS